MTYYEWWQGDQYIKVVDEYERACIYEYDSWARFVQLNNLP